METYGTNCIRHDLDAEVSHGCDAAFVFSRASTRRGRGINGRVGHTAFYLLDILLRAKSYTSYNAALLINQQSLLLLLLRPETHPVITKHVPLHAILEMTLFLA